MAKQLNPKLIEALNKMLQITEARLNKAINKGNQWEVELYTKGIETIKKQL